MFEHRAAKAFLGVGRWISNDFDGAAAAMRTAMKLDPDEPSYRQKLVGILRQQVGILLEQHRCAEAAIEEGLALAPSDELFLQASRACGAKSH